jgi:hypothetical protein
MSLLYLQQRETFHLAQEQLPILLERAIAALILYYQVNDFERVLVSPLGGTRF